MSNLNEEPKTGDESLTSAQTAEGFAYRLKEALKLLDIPRTEFASKLGVPGPNLSQWLSGVSMWNAMMLAKAQFLYPQVNMFYVTGGDAFGKLENSLLMQEAKIVDPSQMRDETEKALAIAQKQIFSLENERAQYEFRIRDLEKITKLYELLMKANGVELP